VPCEARVGVKLLPICLPPLARPPFKKSPLLISMCLAKSIHKTPFHRSLVVLFLPPPFAGFSEHCLPIVVCRDFCFPALLLKLLSVLALWFKYSDRHPLFFSAYGLSPVWPFSCFPLFKAPSPIRKAYRAFFFGRFF